ncbi:MAG: hypothetical protein KKI12_13140 [Proteobacteria bacterium]|nr:hypothetical protein [Pseudomonadota bacterium]
MLSVSFSLQPLALYIQLILPAPLCPVKFPIGTSEANLTRVAPADGTGVNPACPVGSLLSYWGPIKKYNLGGSKDRTGVNPACPACPVGSLLSYWG